MPNILPENVSLQPPSIFLRSQSFSGQYY